MTEFLAWSNFLPEHLVAQARWIAISNRDKMVDSTTTTGEPGYRQSKILWHYDWQKLYDGTCARILEYYGNLREAFPSYVSEVPGNIELQMTLHHNGDFFKKHIDNGDAGTATRTLTMIVYFTIEDQKMFEGGELVIWREDGTSMSVTPEHNSFVAFPSHLYHEVLPVRNDGEFVNCRGTLNGWLHRAT